MKSMSIAMVIVMVIRVGNSSEYFVLNLMKLARWMLYMGLVVVNNSGVI